MNQEPENQLAVELRRLRKLRGQSLRQVAEQVDYSSAYLSKLEQGSVKTPSPHLLRALAEAYGVSYLSLMSLTGYEVADGVAPAGAERVRPRLIADALATDDYSEAELDAIVAFVTSLKAQRK